MRLKPIEPGMVIHCKTQEEKKILLEELEKQGYTWPGGKKPTDSSNLAFSSIHVNTDGCDYITWSGQNGNIEFYDLIIPELSAEEVFEIMAEMHKECYGKINGCLGCPIRIVAEHCDADCFGKNAKAIIEVCEQWKVDHSEKEPEVEIEWFWQGMIYRVLDSGSITQLPNGEGIYDTGCEFRESAEDYMADELKEFCKCHEGRYIAVIDRVCRAKGA